MRNTTPRADARPSHYPVGWYRDRIARIDEESPCQWCGWPLDVADECIRSASDALLACGATCAHKLHLASVAEGGAS